MAAYSPTNLGGDVQLPCAVPGCEPPPENGSRVTSCGFRHSVVFRRGAALLQAPSIDSGEMLLVKGLAPSLRGGAISPPSPAQGPQGEQPGVNPVLLHGFPRVHTTSWLLLPSPAVRTALHTSWGDFKKVQVKQLQGLATSPHPRFQATICFGRVNTNYVPLLGEKAEQLPRCITSGACLEWITYTQNFLWLPLFFGKLL